MFRRQFAALILLFTLLAPFAAFGQQPQGPQQPAPDPNDPIVRIKDEGMNRSQVMQTLSYLSDVIGPRLTASPNMKRACEWTRDTMSKWGLQNAHLEAWGPFGRGWSLKRFSDQPRPKGPHASRCAFCKPHLVIVSRVHSQARFIFGEAVKRGPMTSLRYESVCITCERFMPSSLMRTIGSLGSGAGCCGPCGCWPNAAKGASSVKSRIKAANWRRNISGNSFVTDFGKSARLPRDQ